MNSLVAYGESDDDAENGSLAGHSDSGKDKSVLNAPAEKAAVGEEASHHTTGVSFFSVVSNQGSFVGPCAKDCLSLQVDEPEKKSEAPTTYRMSLQEKVNEWAQLPPEADSITEALLKHRQFRNPNIVTKLIDYLQIQEYDSMLPLSQWNPSMVAGEDNMGWSDHLGKPPPVVPDYPPFCFFFFTSHD